MKNTSFVALIVVLATVLGATVFREPIALAAQTVSATIAGPLDADGNVRVHEQGVAKAESADQTKLLLEHRFSQAGESQTLDVSDYREIRVTFSDCGTGADGSPVYLELYQVTPGGERYPLDRTTVSCSETTRSYEVPGRQLELSVGALARPRFAIAVYGRAN